MLIKGARWRLFGVLLGAMLLLGACAHGHRSGDAAGDNGINVYPANYKSDILAAMHVYLNDPTQIRNSGISEPMQKSIGGARRYIVCLRYNPRKSPNKYAGVKQIAAVFLAGRFDHFVEAAGEQCDKASYTPFPALEKLSP